MIVIFSFFFFFYLYRFQRNARSLCHYQALSSCHASRHSIVFSCFYWIWMGRHYCFLHRTLLPAIWIHNVKCKIRLQLKANMHTINAYDRSDNILIVNIVCWKTGDRFIIHSIEIKQSRIQNLRSTSGGKKWIQHWCNELTSNVSENSLEILIDLGMACGCSKWLINDGFSCKFYKYMTPCSRNMIRFFKKKKKN